LAVKLHHSTLLNLNPIPILSPLHFNTTTTARRLVVASESSASGDGNLHMALGMALQSWDTQEHTGGTHQPEALSSYRTALKLGNVRNEDLCTLHLNCGVLLTTMSKPSDALESFQQALDLKKKKLPPHSQSQSQTTSQTTSQPEHDDLVSTSQTCQLRYYSGMAYSSMGSLREAEGEFLEVLAMDPHYTRAYSSLVALAKDDVNTSVEWKVLVPMLKECLAWLEGRLKTQLAGPLLLGKAGGGGEAAVGAAMAAALKEGNPNPTVPLRALIAKLTSAAASLPAASPPSGSRGGGVAAKERSVVKSAKGNGAGAGRSLAAEDEAVDSRALLSSRSAALKVSERGQETARGGLP